MGAQPSRICSFLLPPVFDNNFIALQILMIALKGLMTYLWENMQDAPGAQGTLKLTLCQGLYHDVAPGLCREHGQPQLVFCPNAGA